MKDEGYTWSDLAGELMARGIDPDSVRADELNLNAPTPEQCADEVSAGREEGRKR